MSLAAFFTPDAQHRTAETIAKIESETSAEVVVAVRKRSDPYRQADYLFGFVFAVGVLALLLFLPQDFAIEYFPLDVAVGFLVGAVICNNVPGLKRLFAGRTTLDRTVRSGALRAFHELGISRTSGRTGVLVYVSILEKRVELVPDIGVDPAAVEGWDGIVGRLRMAVKHRNLDAFEAALVELGPPLGRVLPRADDDVNELPDAVHAA